jgi:hypothetical protein
MKIWAIINASDNGHLEYFLENLMLILRLLELGINIVDESRGIIVSGI